MERHLRIGDRVVFIDQHRQQHDALVTNVFDGGKPAEYPRPAINVVWCSSDESKTDPYGRQLERQTSCSHVSQNTARAMCWAFVGEEIPDPV